MWLLDTHTLTLQLFQTPPSLEDGGEPYAILSHVWSAAGEQTFQELRAIAASTRRPHRRLLRRLLRSSLQNDERISLKIRDCCALARSMGYRLLWIDSCCIDKTSSAELSEAISSMYEWYSRAAVCFAFLYDVGDDQDPAAQGSAFRRSRWFRRGWTLQELVAPRDVLFLSRDWRMLGTKENLASVIEDITGVDCSVLLFEETPASISVARRMSWASDRFTTRVEDEAYALLGIFGIHIPIMYGEGRNAFLRLQEEILRKIPDQTIFVWGFARASVFDKSDWNNITTMHTVGAGVHETIDLYGRVFSKQSRFPPKLQYLLADTPSLFRHSSRISPIPINTLARRIGCHLDTTQYTITSYGIQMTLPLIPVQGWLEGKYLAILACEDEEGRLLALALSKPSGEHFYSVGFHYYSIGVDPNGSWYRNNGGLRRAVLLPLMAHTFIDSTPVTATNVCISQRAAFHAPASVEARRGGRQNVMFTGPCTITIPQWILAHLARENIVPMWEGLALFTLEAGRPYAPSPPLTLALKLSQARRQLLICIALCPSMPGPMPSGSSRIPLHVSVALFEEAPPPSRPVKVSDCVSEHVAHWKGAAKTWDVQGLGAVTLIFKSWPCGSHSSVGALVLPLLALEVRVDRRGSPRVSTDWLP